MQRYTIDRDDRAERVASVAAVAAIHAALGWALLSGLGVPLAKVIDDPLAAFDVTPPPPPRPVEPPPETRPQPRERSGRASPPNLKANATELVAPDVISLPPPVVVAPIARTGADPNAGNAPVVGPGYGAGGVGDGTGSGGYGNGAGGGGGGGQPLRFLRGRIDDDDYPRAAIEARASGVVTIRFTVGVDGRATGCRVTRSSGNAALDDTTCRLIEKRLRYRPSLDARGRPYADTVTGTQEWSLHERMARPDEQDD